MALGKKYGGRVKGTPNKVKRGARQAFQDAFDALEESGFGLTRWAMANRLEFYKLYAKLLPLDLAIKGNITLNVVTGVEHGPELVKTIPLLQHASEVDSTVLSPLARVEKILAGA